MTHIRSIYLTDEQAEWLRRMVYEHRLRNQAEVIRLALERLMNDPQVDQLLDQLRQQGSKQ